MSLFELDTGRLGAENRTADSPGLRPAAHRRAVPTSRFRNPRINNESATDESRQLTLTQGVLMSHRHLRFRFPAIAVAILIAAAAVVSLSDRGASTENFIVKQVGGDFSGQTRGEKSNRNDVDGRRKTPGERRQLRAFKRHEQRRAKWLRSPQAKRERESSRKKYAGLGPKAALATARNEQPSVAETPIWSPPELERGQAIAGYLGSHTARIVDSEEPGDRGSSTGSQLVHSTGYPFAVEDGKSDRFKPLDLSLRATASGERWVPDRQFVPTLIPVQSDEAVQIGSNDTGGAIRMKPSAARSRGVVTSETKVFYANSDIDTDTLVEPTPLGASFSWLLRSRQAPESQSLELDLPHNVSLELAVDGAAELKIGAKTIADVSRPVAFDAQGQPVSSRFRKDGDSLIVEIVHRNLDVAYPIAVDPVFNYYGISLIAQEANQPASESWFTSSTSNNARLVAFTNASTSGAARHNIETRGTSGAATAAWTYDPVRNSTVTKIDWNNVIKSHTGVTLTTGIALSNGAFQPGQVVWYSGGGPYYGGPFGNGSGLTISSGIPVVTCANAGCVDNAGYTDTTARFEIVAASNAAAFRHAEFLGANVFVKDYAPPTIQSVAGMPSPIAWRKSGSVTPTAQVYDAGVGVGNPDYGTSVAGAAMEVQLDGGVPYNSGPNCTGDPYAGQTCPDSFSAQKTVNFEGSRQVGITSRDILGRASATQYFGVKNDATGPEIDLSGKLGAMALDTATLGTAEPRSVVDDTPFIVAASDGRSKNDDGSAAHGKYRRSGVKSISAVVNGSNDQGVENTGNQVMQLGTVSVAGDDTDCDPGPGFQDSCGLTLSGNFKAKTGNLAPGVYYIRVTATDFVYNTSTKIFKVGVGVAEILGVTDGQATARYVPLQVKKLASTSSTALRLQYRTQNNEPWCDVPASAVVLEATRTAVSWPYSLGSSSLSPSYVIDLDPLRRRISISCGFDAGPLPDGPVRLRAVMEGSGPEFARASEDVTIQYDQGGRDANDDAAQLGPGAVDLVTGNFSMSATDVSIDSYKSDLTVSRTYNSRYGDAEGVLGGGWELGLPSTSGAEYASVTDYADVDRPEELRDPSVDVEMTDGERLTFEMTETAGVYKPEQGFEHLKLERIPHPSGDPARNSGFKLTDVDTGTVGYFEARASASEAGKWQTTRVSNIGSPDKIRFTYRTDVLTGKSVVDTAFAPVGDSGVSCGNDFASIPRGCQALKFTYSVPSGITSKRLEKISLRTYDFQQEAMRQEDVARYSYNTMGRLENVWDPRISPALKNAYGYNTTAGHALLQSIQPAGELPFTIAYNSLAEDNKPGRVSTVSRSALAAGTATWSVRYYVPTTTAQGSAAPMDMTDAAVDQWGQDSSPWTATAVFPPDQLPNGTPATNYTRASVSYLDPLGREVNALEPGGRMNATEYNEHGEVTRTLSTENRARAMWEDSLAEKQAAANRMSTEHTYANVSGSPNGRRHLTDTHGPWRQVRLENGTVTQARQHTKLTYDDGISVKDPDTNEPFDLVTSSEVSAWDGENDLDTRRTETDYGSTAAELKFRTPRLVTADPGSGNLNIKQKVSLNTDGLVTERFQPRSQNSGEPSTTRTIYYTNQANATDPQCGGKPEWMGLPCKTGPGTQPGAASGMPGLPVQTITYNY